MKKIKKITDILYKVLFIGLLIIAGLAALSTLGLPKQLKLFVVQTGSMEPTIKTGSLVAIRPSEDYQEENIITYKVSPEADVKNPNLTITHRIVEIEETDEEVFYTTKGDANQSPDMDPVSKDLVLGKVIFTIPYLGYPVGFAKTQTGFILLIVIPATMIIYSEILNIKNEAVKILAEKKKKKVSAKVKK